MNQHEPWSDEELLRERQEMPTQLTEQKRQQMREHIDLQTHGKRRSKTLFALGGSAVAVVAVVTLMVGSWLHSNHMLPRTGEGLAQGVVNGPMRTAENAAPNAASPASEPQNQAQQNSQKQANTDTLNPSGWRAVSPFYWVQGTITGMDATSPAWTIVSFQADGFSQLPNLGGSSSAGGNAGQVDFYNLADHGTNRMQIGQSVLFRLAYYATPGGKVVLGCLYQDVYYKTDSGFANTAGAKGPLFTGQ